jgi:hypothetical protein
VTEKRERARGGDARRELRETPRYGWPIAAVDNRHVFYEIQ